MTFEPSRIEGAWLIRSKPRADERGWFARTFCAEEFSQRGLILPTVQSSLSFNHEQATLRGLHWQRSPYGEVKLVRCLRGAIWDVLADVRHDSPTRGRWQGFELNEKNGLSLYVPEGVAHGFLTLQADSLISYQISAPYHPEASAGVRWNDPAFAIEWPLEPRILSESDRQWSDWHALPQTAISTSEGALNACRP